MKDKIIKIILQKFKQENGYDLPKNDKMAIQRITEASQKAANNLKNSDKTNINLPFIYADENGPKHLSFSITKFDLNNFSYNFKDDYDIPKAEKHISSSKSKNDMDKITDNYLDVKKNSYMKKIISEKNKQRRQKRDSFNIILIVLIILISIVLLYFFLF